MSDEVLVERPGAVQVITIKRPEARNALNRAVAVGVRDAVDELVRRSDFDDLRVPIPCYECNEQCGGSTGNVPLHWAEVTYKSDNSEPRFICEACTKKAGAEFIWKIAQVVDDVDFLFYAMDQSTENLERAADLIDFAVPDITERWRRMIRHDF